MSIWITLFILKVVTSKWMARFVGGDKSVGDHSMLGETNTIKEFNSGNWPGSRRSVTGWVSSHKSTEIFFYCAVGRDIWIYSTTLNQWKLIFGGDDVTYPSHRYHGSSNVYDEGNYVWTFGMHCASLYLEGEAEHERLFLSGRVYLNGQNYAHDDFWMFNEETYMWKHVWGHDILDYSRKYGLIDNYESSTAPGGRSSGCLLPINNDEYMVIGGVYFVNGNKNYLNDVMVFSLQQNMWKTKRVSQIGENLGVQNEYDQNNYPSGRNNFIVVRVNENEILLIGGDSSNCLHVDEWKFDLNINQWKYIGGPDGCNPEKKYNSGFEDSPGGRGFGSNYIALNSGTPFEISKTGSHYADEIVFFAGYESHSEYNNDLWIYNVALGQWKFTGMFSNTPNMESEFQLFDGGVTYSSYNKPSARCLFAFVPSTITGEIYIFGGYSHESSSSSELYVMNELWTIMDNEVDSFDVILLLIIGVPLTFIVVLVVVIIFFVVCVFLLVKKKKKTPTKVVEMDQVEVKKNDQQITNNTTSTSIDEDPKKTTNDENKKEQPKEEDQNNDNSNTKCEKVKSILKKCYRGCVISLSIGVVLIPFFLGSLLFVAVGIGGFVAGIVLGIMGIIPIPMSIFMPIFFFVFFSVSLVFVSISILLCCAFFWTGYSGDSFSALFTTINSGGGGGGGGGGSSDWNVGRNSNDFFGRSSFGNNDDNDFGSHSFGNDDNDFGGGFSDDDW